MPEVCISNFYREVAECIMEHLYVAYAKYMKRKDQLMYCSVKKCNNEGRQQMQLDIDEIWTLLTSIHKIEYGIRSLVMDQTSYLKG